MNVPEMKNNGGFACAISRHNYDSEKSLVLWEGNDKEKKTSTKTVATAIKMMMMMSLLIHAEVRDQFPTGLGPNQYYTW
jgi:hypothetical protein